ncbi:MAG: ATP-binding protein [Anaerolineae bacterium]
MVKESIRSPARSWRGLRSQILLWVVLPLTILLLVLSFTGIYSHQRAMRALVEERDLALATLAAKGVAESLARCQTVLENIRDHEALRHSEPIDHNQLLGELSSRLRIFDGGVALWGEDGELIAAEPDTAVWATRVQTMEPYLEQITASQEPIFLTASEEPLLNGSLVALIVPGVGRVRALVGLFSPAGCGATETLAGLAVGGEGVAYLIDREGTILYHPNPSRLGSNALTQLGVDRASLAEAGSGVYQDTTGRDVVLAYGPVEQAGWAVIVQEPWSDLIAPMMHYSQITPLIVLLVALVAFLAIYLGVRWVLQPLEELGRRANKIAWGDFSAARDPVGGIAEIDELRATLNQMADRIRTYQSAMRNYVAAVTRGQEEERLRLGHELHDDTVQSLIALSQGLERAQRDAPAVAEALRERLAELRGLTNSIIGDLRRYISDLRPVYLEDLGLIPALEKLVGDLSASQGVDAGLKVVGTPRRLASDVELTIFRIVQEALKNIEQHAQASRVEVKLEFDSDGITMFIEDDGIGFEAPETPSELTERGHFGLMGMQERAMLLGGWLSIGSEPGQGTKIVTYLPV